MVIADDQRDGATRYQMLETLRQYALERLDERGDADRWRRRHAMHFAALVDEIAAGCWAGRVRVAGAPRNPSSTTSGPRLAWAIDLEERDR